MKSGTCSSASCDCGHLSIEVRSWPFLQLVCHCSDCRSISGQPFTEIAFFAPGTPVIKGESLALTMKGSSGHNKTYYSCPTCKVVMCASVDGVGGALGVVASRLRPFKFRPLMHVWVSAKAPDTQLPRFALKYAKSPPKLGASLLRWGVRTFARPSGANPA